MLRKCCWLKKQCCNSEVLIYFCFVKKKIFFFFICISFSFSFSFFHLWRLSLAVLVAPFTTLDFPKFSQIFPDFPHFPHFPHLYIIFHILFHFITFFSQLCFIYLNFARIPFLATNTPRFISPNDTDNMYIPMLAARISLRLDLAESIPVDPGAPSNLFKLIRIFSSFPLLSNPSGFWSHRNKSKKIALRQVLWSRSGYRCTRMERDHHMLHEPCGDHMSRVVTTLHTPWQSQGPCRHHPAHVVVATLVMAASPHCTVGVAVSTVALILSGPPRITWLAK